MGTAITSFADQNEGWVDVVKGIKNVCLSINQTQNLKIKDKFETFLDNTELLAKSHKEKETLLLKDIFVFPKLNYYDDKEESHKYDSSKFATKVLQYGKIIIAGENQSGKTTLCKELFRIFQKLNFVPVYLEDNNNKYLGNPHNKIEKAFSEQYENVDFEKIDKKRIVPIVDNFHMAKHQEKYIEHYNDFPNHVLIVDDIFDLDMRNRHPRLIQDYCKFTIREFTALERNELIQKWIHITENDQIQANSNHLQKSIDEKTELIENSLGVAFGKGIMPSYPFFILSAQEIQKPLDTEITSQGYCYQALIYLYLRKERVKNDQIDIYINFLTELAFWLYDKKCNDLDPTELEEFSKYYESNFNLPISIKKISKVLSNVNICKFDSLNQYHFCYDYLYYFFIAKYLAEHIKEKEELINNVFANLHKDKNAYITIFIAHHTKSNYILDKLLYNAKILFEKYKPATLNTDELSFFDGHEEQIVKAILPSYQNNAHAERNQFLTHKSETEDKREKSEARNFEDNDRESDLVRNLRLSIKTVEVIGLVLKNRSGSLGLERLKDIFEQGLNVHLRIITSFLELIQNEQSEQEIIEFLIERINNIIGKNVDNKELRTDKIKKLAKEIYWNLNFGVLYGILTKSIHSLGSNNLLKIAQIISEKKDNPATFIVYHGIKMWYTKNVRTDKIADRIKQKDFSLTAKKLIQYKVAEHCILHKIEHQKLKEIGSKLQLSSNKILAEKSKNQSE